MSRPMVCFLNITLIILFLNSVRRLPSFIRVQRLIPFTIHLHIYFTPLHYPILIFSTDHSIPRFTLLTLSSTAPTS